MSRDKGRLTGSARWTKKIEAHVLGHIYSSQTEVDTSSFQREKEMRIKEPPPGMEAPLRGQAHSPISLILVCCVQWSSSVDYLSTIYTKIFD